MSKDNLKRNILVTNALPYANGSLHLGHMLEHIQSDIWVRFQKLINNNCTYVCGEDAHGTSIMLKAEERGIKPEELINEINKNFVVKKVINECKPHQKNEFGMFLDNAWYQLNLRENLNTNNDPVASLDVAILHDLIISPLLGIDDERRDKRINFVGGARGLKELEKRVKNDAYDIAFSLFPTPIESLFKVADADRVMPPKSTWFEPKLLDGLISHVIS